MLLAGIIAVAQEPDATYKLLREEWTVNADGTTDYHHRHEVAILRNRALTAYADKGETFVVYNPDFEEVAINEVYTLQADGTRVEMPQNAYVYQLSSACADCGRFNHLRELVMVHTGMEIGCTIVVDYTIHRRTGLLNQSLSLVRDCPIERLEIGINLPADQTLTTQFTNPGVLAFNPEVEQTDHTYRLTATDVPQAFVDSYLPSADQLYPTLRFLNGIPEYTPMADEAVFTSPETDALAAQGSTREKASALRNYVVDHIHLNDLSPALTAYTRSTPETVWQTGCGTAADKAVLLSALLNGQGLEAHPIGDNLDEVGVMIDSLEYRLTLRSKAPLALIGEARDEVVSHKSKQSHPALKLDTLADGFFRLHLEPLQGPPAINVRNLALSRTAPLQSSACDLDQTDTYTLPAGIKMESGTISRSLRFDNIGSVEIKIKQSGRKLTVARKLKLESSVVAPSDYAAYRQLTALWQQHTDLLLRKK